MYEERVQILKEELQKKVVCEGCSQRNGGQPHDNFSMETAELRKTCLVLQQERDALLSAQHVNANTAEMTSLILKENTALKNQVQCVITCIHTYTSDTYQANFILQFWLYR